MWNFTLSDVIRCGVMSGPKFLQAKKEITIEQILHQTKEYLHREAAKIRQEVAVTDKNILWSLHYLLSQKKVFQRISGGRFVFFKYSTTKSEKRNSVSKKVYETRVAFAFDNDFDGWRETVCQPVFPESHPDQEQKVEEEEEEEQEKEEEKEQQQQNETEKKDVDFQWIDRSKLSIDTFHEEHNLMEEEEKVVTIEKETEEKKIESDTEEVDAGPLSPVFEAKEEEQETATPTQRPEKEIQEIKEEANKMDIEKVVYMEEPLPRRLSHWTFDHFIRALGYGKCSVSPDRLTFRLSEDAEEILIRKEEMKASERIYNRLPKGSIQQALHQNDLRFHVFKNVVDVQVFYHVVWKWKGMASAFPRRHAPEQVLSDAIRCFMSAGFMEQNTDPAQTEFARCIRSNVRSLDAMRKLEISVFSNFDDAASVYSAIVSQIGHHDFQTLMTLFKGSKRIILGPAVQQA
jgi:hypothetical protein